jgi:hypothetical protein
MLKLRNGKLSMAPRFHEGDGGGQRMTLVGTRCCHANLGGGRRSNP